MTRLEYRIRWCAVAFSFFLIPGSNGWAASRGLLDQMVLHPSKQPITSLGEKKILPSGLEVYLYRRKNDKPNAHSVYLIHFIGNASRAERECPEFLNLFPEEVRPEIWVVNYPGYGGSSGEATLKALAPAAIDVYDYLSKNVAQDAPIWVSSFSIGTLPALYLAKERSVQSIVLRNPIPLKEFILKNYSWAGWITSEIPPQLNVIQNAGKVKAPALILSSEKDDTVDPSLQRKVIEAYGGKKEVVIMPGIKHNDPIPQGVYPEIQRVLRALTN